MIWECKASATPEEPAGELQPCAEPAQRMHGRRITFGWWHRGNYESNSEAL